MGSRVLSLQGYTLDCQPVLYYWLQCLGTCLRQLLPWQPCHVLMILVALFPGSLYCDIVSNLQPASMTDELPSSRQHISLLSTVGPKALHVLM